MEMQPLKGLELLGAREPSVCNQIYSSVQVQLPPSHGRTLAIFRGIWRASTLQRGFWLSCYKSFIPCQSCHSQPKPMSLTANLCISRAPLCGFPPRAPPHALKFRAPGVGSGFSWLLDCSGECESKLWFVKKKRCIAPQNSHAVWAFMFACSLGVTKQPDNYSHS